MSLATSTIISSGGSSITTTTAAPGGGGVGGGGAMPGPVSCVSSLGATTLSCSGTFAIASAVGAAAGPTQTAEAAAMRALLGGAVAALAYL